MCAFIYNDDIRLFLTDQLIIDLSGLSIFCDVMVFHKLPMIDDDDDGNGLDVSMDYG